MATLAKCDICGRMRCAYHYMHWAGAGMGSTCSDCASIVPIEKILKAECKFDYGLCQPARCLTCSQELAPCSAEYKGPPYHLLTTVYRRDGCFPSEHAWIEHYKDGGGWEGPSDIMMRVYLAVSRYRTGTTRNKMAKVEAMTRLETILRAQGTEPAALVETLRAERELLRRALARLEKRLARVENENSNTG